MEHADWIYFMLFPYLRCGYLRKCSCTCDPGRAHASDGNPIYQRNVYTLLLCDKHGDFVNTITNKTFILLFSPSKVWDTCDPN